MLDYERLPWGKGANRFEDDVMTNPDITFSKWLAGSFLKYAKNGFKVWKNGGKWSKMGENGLKSLQI